MGETEFCLAYDERLHVDPASDRRYVQCRAADASRQERGQHDGILRFLRGTSFADTSTASRAADERDLQQQSGEGAWVLKPRRFCLCPEVKPSWYGGPCRASACGKPACLPALTAVCRTYVANTNGSGPC